MCNVCNVYDSAVCVSACVHVCVCVFNSTASVCECVCADNGEIFHNCHHERRATLLTHNCLERCIVQSIREVFTIFRKLLKYNFVATRVAYVLYVSRNLNKKSPEISKNPQKSSRISRNIQLDQKVQGRIHMIQTDTKCK